MVRLPENRSRIAACCWRVLVLNGASGLSSFSTSSTSATRNGAAAQAGGEGRGVALALGRELPPLPGRQLGRELVGFLGLPGRGQRGGDPPVLLGNERADL